MPEPRLTGMGRSAVDEGTWHMSPVENPNILAADFPSMERAKAASAAIYNAFGGELSSSGIKGPEALFTCQAIDYHDGGLPTHRLQLSSDALYTKVKGLLDRSGIHMRFLEPGVADIGGDPIIALTPEQKTKVEMGAFTGDGAYIQPYGFFKSQDDAQAAAAALFEAMSPFITARLANLVLKKRLPSDTKLGTPDSIFAIKKINGIHVLSVRNTQVIGDDIQDPGKINIGPVVIGALIDTQAACHYPDEVAEDLRRRAETKSSNAIPTHLIPAAVSLSEDALYNRLGRCR